MVGGLPAEARFTPIRRSCCGGTQCRVAAFSMSPDSECAGWPVPPRPARRYWRQSKNTSSRRRRGCVITTRRCAPRARGYQTAAAAAARRVRHALSDKYKRCPPLHGRCPPLSPDGARDRSRAPPSPKRPSHRARRRSRGNRSGDECASDVLYSSPQNRDASSAEHYSEESGLQLYK